VLAISGLSRGFSTCCLRFKSGVAITPAKLASGWLARLYREGVDPLDRYKRFQIIFSSPFSGFILALGRLAFQAVPAWVIDSLSLLPAFAVRHPVCIHPSCTSWSLRWSALSWA